MADHHDQLTKSGDVAVHTAKDVATSTPPGAQGVLQLQATAGNQSVIRFLDVAQAKLTVGAVDDPLEHEADRVADAVVRSLRAPSTVGIDHVSRLTVRRMPQ